MSHKCKFPETDGFNPKTVKCLNCEKLLVYIPKVVN